MTPATAPNVPTVLRETIGATLRRIRARAYLRNPVENPILLGSTPWVASTAKTLGQIIGNAGNLYICSAAGTTGASNPFTTSNAYSSSITDNTATWAYYGRQTAPTATWSYSHNAALTALYAASSSLTDGAGIFRFRGGVPTSFASPDAASTAVGMPSVTVTSGGNFASTQSQYYNAASFGVEATKAEIKFSGNGCSVSVIVDGQYVDLDPATALMRNTNGWFLTLDWTYVQARQGPYVGVGRALHDVIVEFSPGNSKAGLVQLAVAPVDSAFPTFQTDNFSVGLVSDSMGAGTGAIDANSYLSYQASWAARFMHRTGLPDIVQVAVPGSGYITTATSPAVAGNYISHAVSDLLAAHAFRPLKMILISGSSNDNSLAVASVQAAALALYQAIRAVAAFATAPLIVMGQIDGAQTSYASAIACENAVAAGVAQQKANGDQNIYFVPIITDSTGKWISGTGKVGGTTGVGNSDFDIYSDALHPSNAGHGLWERRLDSIYEQIVASMT